MSQRAGTAPALHRYVIGVSAVGLATLAAMTVTGILRRSFPTPEDGVIFLIAIIGSQVPLVTVRRRMGEDEATVADTFAFAAILLFSPAFAALGMAAGSILADLRRGKAAHRIIFNVAQYSLSVALAGAVVSIGHARFGGTVGIGHAAVGLSAGFVFFSVNWVLVGVAVALKQRSRISEFLATDLKSAAWHSVSSLSQGFLAALVFPLAHWSLVLFLPAAHTVHVAVRRHQALRQQARQAMETLAAVLDDRDQTTSQHSSRVSQAAVAVAVELGLNESAVEEIEKAGLVHDLGKVAVPDAVLLKPGPLSPAEMRVMRSHSGHGEQILGNLEIYAPVARVIRHHHERWDGRGYPDGLAGQDIPVASRIIGVVDAFDAMTSLRPYRDPVSVEEALEEIERVSGSQFDPAIVRVFTAVVRADPDAYSPMPRPAEILSHRHAGTASA